MKSFLVYDTFHFNKKYVQYFSIEHLFIYSRYDVQKVLNGTTVYHQPSTLDHVREALEVLTNDSGLNSFNNKMFTYGLLSYDSRNAWQPILTLTERSDGLKLNELVRTGFMDEQFDLLCDDHSDCPGERECF